MWQPHVQWAGSLVGELLPEMSCLPSTILGKEPGLKDMLSGLDRRTGRVGVGIRDSIGVSFV